MLNLSRHTQSILLLQRRTWLIVIEKHSNGMHIFHFFYQPKQNLTTLWKNFNFFLYNFLSWATLFEKLKAIFYGSLFQNSMFFLLFTESILLYHFSILDACNFQNKLENAQLLGILILIEKSISRMSEKKNIASSSDRIFKIFNIEYNAYNQRNHGFCS